MSTAIDNVEYEQPKLAARRFGVSLSFLRQLMVEHKVESFLLRRSPHAKQGVRLVKIASVRLYFERQAAEFSKETGPSPVAAKGREVLAAKRAARKAQKPPKG